MHPVLVLGGDSVDVSSLILMEEDSWIIVVCVLDVPCSFDY